jgi:2-hydroxy-3-keto-5-methylthiopentenyl-1-phosphate phosphatase
VLDLAATSVFLDFDGTVTVEDTGVHVLRRLGRPEWVAVDAEYRSGLIGSREVLSREWPLVVGGLDAALEIAREVAVDAGFTPLVDALRLAGAEVTVVSDGFGFRASEVCEAAGVDVLTNRIDEVGGIIFPWQDRCCPCSTCGVCKQAPIKDARRRGRTTVLVGDGVSDRKAALLADVIYAKNDLADWCDDAGVDYRPFARLDDVQRSLVGAIANRARSD